jgi:hypothetical protein
LIFINFSLRSYFATGPQPPPKRVLHRLRSVTSAFEVRHLTFSVRPSSSCLFHLLSLFASSTVSLMRFLRRLCIRKMNCMNLQLTLSAQFAPLHWTDHWGWLLSRSKGFSLCHNIETSTHTQPLSNPEDGKDFASNKVVDF